VRRARLFASSLLLAAALALGLAASGPASSGRQSVPGRCCFRVSVDVVYVFNLEYKGTVAGSFKGFAHVEGGWSTRFIAGYTGRGLDEGGALGDALVSSDEVETADYDELAPPPRKPTHFSCDSGGKDHDSKSSPFQEVPARDDLARAVRNQNGYARGLEVGNPKTVYPKGCAGLIEGPESHGLQRTTLVVKAPSVDNFLGGQAFSRVCSRTVVGDHANPFPHRYAGYLVVVVRFTYFRRDTLDENRRALDRRAGTVRQPTRAESGAVDDALGEKNATASCR
jgi:hypothetical protein